MKGVYKIKNKINNDFYIGSSINIKKRWNRHLSQLKNNNHSNYWLQQHFNKYGEETLWLEIIELCDDVKKKEQYYLDTLKPAFNINKNASGGDMISNHPFKEQIRKKQLENTRKAACCKNLKDKRRKNAKTKYPNGPMFGLTHSNETKLKMSQTRGIKIEIDGVVYNSLRHAALEHNSNHHAILAKALSKKYPNYKLL